MKSVIEHPWGVSPGEAIHLQQRLAQRVRLQPFELRKGMRIAGCDVSYRRFGSLFHGAVAVLEYPSLEVVETATATLESPFPYVPGLLSFREMPALVAAMQRLERAPDVVMVDGQGIAHPRRLGIAAHLGVWFDIPALGCAKSRLCGTAEEPGFRRGSMTELRDDGEAVGMTLRTRDGVRPVFVSPGHRIDVPSAVEVVLACHGGYRLPEPTRQAHLLANRQRLQREGDRSGDQHLERR